MEGRQQNVGFNVKTPEDWERTCEVCPGSGHGDLIPAEEITRRLKVIKL